MIISSIQPDFFTIIESMTAIELEKAVSTKCIHVLFECILCGFYESDKKYGIQVVYDRSDELFEFFPTYLTPFIHYSYGLLDHFRQFRKRFLFDAIGFYQLQLDQPETEIVHTIGFEACTNTKYYTILYVIEKDPTVSINLLIKGIQYPLISNTCYIIEDLEDEYKMDRYSGLGMVKWIMIKFYEKI